MSAAEVDGLPMLERLSGRDVETTEGILPCVGVLIRFLMLLMRLWLVLIAESSGALDFLCIPALPENCPKESLLALEIKYIALSGRSGTWTGLASHAWNPDRVLIMESRFSERGGGGGGAGDAGLDSCDRGLCTEAVRLFLLDDLLLIDITEGLIFGIRYEIGLAVSNGESSSSSLNSGSNPRS